VQVKINHEKDVYFEFILRTVNESANKKVWTNSDSQKLQWIEMTQQTFRHSFWGQNELFRGVKKIVYSVWGTKATG
jgi:hypothetical protein